MIENKAASKIFCIYDSQFINPIEHVSPKDRLKIMRQKRITDRSISSTSRGSVNSASKFGTPRSMRNLAFKGPRKRGGSIGHAKIRTKLKEKNDSMNNFDAASFVYEINNQLDLAITNLKLVENKNKWAKLGGFGDKLVALDKSEVNESTKTSLVHDELKDKGKPKLRIAKRIFEIKGVHKVYDKLFK